MLDKNKKCYGLNCDKYVEPDIFGSWFCSDKCRDSYWGKAKGAAKKKLTIVEIQERLLLLAEQARQKRPVKKQLDFLLEGISA